MSIGGTIGFAPSDFALLAVASTSVVWKYGSQCGGTCMLTICSFIAIMPAHGVSPTLNSVYVMPAPSDVFSFQPKSDV